MNQVIGVISYLLFCDFVGRGFVVHGKLGNGSDVTPNCPLTVIADAQLFGHPLT
jgi:hypothetical protein